jgi:hypothetical protein
MYSFLRSLGSFHRSPTADIILHVSVSKARKALRLAFVKPNYLKSILSLIGSVTSPGLSVEIAAVMSSFSSPCLKVPSLPFCARAKGGWVMRVLRRCVLEALARAEARRRAAWPLINLVSGVTFERHKDL